MPVREVLARHSAMELAEWAAYEHAYGPLDGAWRDEVMAQMHELTQLVAYLSGCQFEENPAPKPRPLQRPGLLRQPQSEDEE
jgi:hypothetical protein